MLKIFKQNHETGERIPVDEQVNNYLHAHPNLVMVYWQYTVATVPNFPVEVLIVQFEDMSQDAQSEIKLHNIFSDTFGD